MKKFITICIISILSLPIYSNTTENKEVLTSNEVVTVPNSDEKTKEVVVEEKKEESKTIETAKVKNKFIRVKGYLDLPGQLGGYKYGADGKIKLSNIDAGIEGMIEGVYRVSKKTEVAMGLGFQGLGNINTGAVVSDNNYAIPLYISVKRNLFKSPVYLKGIIGVTWNIGSDGLKAFVASQENPTLGLTKDSITLENGLYGAAGVGLDIWKFEIEGLYSVNTIVANYTNAGTKYTRELENHRISVGASYAFDWK